nr:DUF4391 domain-containing protein [Adhaeribacter terrigena]
MQIPERCLVNRKLTKAFFKRNFDLTSAERALLDDPALVSGMDIVASITPASCNVSVYKDDLSDFTEVLIISVQTTEVDFERNQLKIAELIQKHIPYPILLCVYHATTFTLSAADKRINQNDSTRRIVDKTYFSETISQQQPTEQQQVFLDSLAFALLDKTNLKTFYESYIQLLVSLKAAELSGVFTIRTQSRTQDDIAALARIEALQKEISGLQNQVRKETQLKEKVKLNMQVKNLESQVQELLTNLI